MDTSQDPRSEKTQSVCCTFMILNYASAEESIKLARTVSTYDCIDNVLVVDNCSPDASYDTLRACLTGEKMSVIKTDYNGGYGYGNNCGIHHILSHRSACRHELAIISNSDLSVGEGDIKILIDCFLSQHSCFAAGGKQIVTGVKNRVHYPWNIPTPRQCIAQFGYFLAKLIPFDSTDGIDLTRTTSVGCLRGALFMVDCDRFASIGGYDENMFLYYEETVLGIKAQRAGLKSYFCPDSKYYHEVSGSIGKVSNAISVRRHYLHSLSYVVKEYYGFNAPAQLLCKTIGWISLPIYAIRGVKRSLLG